MVHNSVCNRWDLDGDILWDEWSVLSVAAFPATVANLSGCYLPLQKNINNPNVISHMVVWVRPNAVALKKYKVR